MSHTNRALIQRISPRYRDYLGYFPDILFYQHDTIQYHQKIARLAQASYLYSDGYSLKTASLLRYFFETIKGWFGLTNHCQQEKVQLTLQKFVYYGYLQGYPQPQILLQSLGIESDYLNLASGPRTNENSLKIQSKLIQFYVENESELEPAPSNYLPQLSLRYSFGSVLTYLRLWSEIPSIDPQNVQVITTTIERLETETEQRRSYHFIKGSKYAQAVADYYLNRTKKLKERYFYNWSFLTSYQEESQRYLDYAVHFDPEIELREKESYIEHYLQKKQLENAIVLIHQLDNKEQALRYIKNGKYSTQQLLLWVQKDSWLATVISVSNLSQPNNYSTIEIAASLHSNFAVLYPVQAFSLLLSKQKYDEAYTLFSNNKNSVFLAQDIAILADFYSKEGENFYEQGHSLRQSKQWRKAKEYYLKSDSMKRKALELQPDSESRKNDSFTHKRLYAQLLIDADIELNLIEECQIEDILKAIKLLRESNSTEDEEKIFHQKALAKGLIRLVDYLVNRVLTPINYDDYKTRKAHNKENKSNFEQLTQALDQLIVLLHKAQDNELKLILGKAYFLRADVCDYFDLKDYSPSYYIKSQETVPNNPFYLLRCSEIFTENQEKYQEQGIILLKQLGFTVDHYCHWDKERWQRDYRSSPIKDIHGSVAKINHEFIISRF